MSVALELDPVPDTDGSRCLGVAPWRRNAVVSAGCFLAVVACLRWPDLFDRPLSRWIGAQVGRDPIVDRVFFAFDIYFTFSGVVLMALIWACWAGHGGAEARERILVGVPVAFGAGVLSRFVQHAVPSHLRPLYDAAVAFHPPGHILVADLNTWNSFPSDHVTVFAGLVAVLFTVRSRLAFPAALWAVLVEASRLYMGAHFLSDMVGGAALGSLCVWCVQGRPWIALGERVLRFERSSAPAFYAAAFFVSFQVATLFIELRGLTGGFSLLHSLH